MAKAVLVMDMPETCFGCNFGYLGFDEEDTCQAYEKVRKIDSDTYEKPDWCPLRKLPEEKEELPVDKYEFGSIGKTFVSGWNACLNKILK